MSVRRTSYTIILGTCLLVIVYAILHDQYLVRIAPEHFTVYHEPLWGIENPPLLAAAYAFCAAFVPGLALGLTCAAITTYRNRTPPRTWLVLRGVLCVIIATELLSAASGLYVYVTKNPLYPAALYPDESLPLLVTQTIQLTCYLAGAAFSCVLFAILIRGRLQTP